MPRYLAQSSTGSRKSSQMRPTVQPPTFRKIFCGSSRLLRCDTGKRSATRFLPPRRTSCDSRLVFLRLNWSPSSTPYSNSLCSDVSSILRFPASGIKWLIATSPMQRTTKILLHWTNVSASSWAALTSRWREWRIWRYCRVGHWTRLARNQLHCLPLHASPSVSSIAYNIDGRDCCVLRGSAFGDCWRYWGQTCRAHVSRVCLNAIHCDLAVPASGKKLVLMVIWKGEDGGKLEREGNLYVELQGKAWVNSLLLRWLEFSFLTVFDANHQVKRSSWGTQCVLISQRL